MRKSRLAKTNSIFPLLSLCNICVKNDNFNGKVLPEKTGQQWFKQLISLCFWVLTIYSMQIYSNCLCKLRVPLIVGKIKKYEKAVQLQKPYLSQIYKSSWWMLKQMTNFYHDKFKIWLWNFCKNQNLNSQIQKFDAQFANCDLLIRTLLYKLCD